MVPVVHLVYIVAALLLCGAALTDVRTRLIPNRISLAVFLCAITVIVLTGQPVHIHMVSALCALLLGIAGFSLRWFGGGDGKLFAALATFFRPGELLFLIAVIAVVGLVQAVGFLILEKYAPRERRTLPYGVAIAFGGLIALSTRTLALT